MSEARTSGAFTVIPTSTDAYISVAVKLLVNVVKYLEFLAKGYSRNVFAAVDVNIVSYLYCVLYE